MAKGVDADTIIRAAKREGYTLVLDEGGGSTLRWANLVGEFDPSIELSTKVQVNHGAIVERLFSEREPSTA